MNLVIVAALENELADLIHAFDARAAASAGKRPVFLGRWEGRRVGLVPLGVGVVSAAMTLGALLHLLEGSEVIMVGTAGAMPGSGLQKGDLAVATRESLAEMGVSIGHGIGDAELLGMAEPRQTLPLDPELTGRIHAAAETVAATSSGPFVTVAGSSGTPELAAFRAGRFSALAENMEGYALAAAAEPGGFRAAQVRGICNMAGDRDRSGWTFESARKRAQSAVLEYLRHAR